MLNVLECVLLSVLSMASKHEMAIALGASMRRMLRDFTTEMAFPFPCPRWTLVID